MSVEVDNNVTRHVDEELWHSDCDVIMLQAEIGMIIRIKWQLDALYFTVTLLQCVLVCVCVCVCWDIDEHKSTRPKPVDSGFFDSDWSVVRQLLACWSLCIVSWAAIASQCVCVCVCGGWYECNASHWRRATSQWLGRDGASLSWSGSHRSHGRASQLTGATETQRDGCSRRAHHRLTPSAGACYWYVALSVCLSVCLLVYLPLSQSHLSSNISVVVMNYHFTAYIFAVLFDDWYTCLTKKSESLPRSISMPAGFCRHLVGKTVGNVCYSAVT